MIGMPIGASSQKPSGRTCSGFLNAGFLPFWYVSRSTLSTERLVLVPTSVTVPPMIAAYESGIRSFEGDIFIRLASWTKMGR